MSRDRVHCIDCGEPIPSDARICPHCETVQPSPLVDVGLAVTGVFVFVFGAILALMTLGGTRLLGFTMIVLGFGLAVGGYTRHIDRQSGRRAR